MHERIIIHNPSEGFPYANNPNRKTQASILINITCLMPNRFKKNGIAKINTVSEICEIDIIIVEYFTTNESLNSEIFAKSERKVSPYIFVN